MGSCGTVILLAVFAATCLCASPARVGAQPPNGAIPQVKFNQLPGNTIPQSLEFVDETGKTVHLSDYFGKHPVVLAPVYYECPMLCNQTLNGIGKALETVSLDPGKDFTTLAISFNPKEGTALARKKRATYLDRFDREGIAKNWHFLTGKPEAIKKFTDAIGFEYKLDKETGQYAHPAGIVIATPEGKVSRYLFGVEFAPRDLRLSLVEASDGKIGEVSDQLLLLCFCYDPTKGKYGLMIMRLIQVTGAITVVALGGLIYFCSRSAGRKQRLEATAESQAEDSDG